MKKLTSIDRSKRYISIILWIACLTEAIFFFSWENLCGCAELIYGWGIVSAFVLKQEYIRRYPLPTIAIFGYAFCYHVLPLLITLIEGKPITFNFQVPYSTFFNQFLFITTTVIAFRICIRFYRQNNILNKIWNKIGYLTPPSDKIIWILGFIGLGCILVNLSRQDEHIEVQATGNALGIVINTLSILSVVPVCLLFKKFYSAENENIPYKKVAYYVGMVMLIGIASTRRTIIFNAVATIMLIGLFSKYYFNKKLMSTKSLVMVILGIYVATGPLADLATAMILSRHRTGTESASKTFDYVLDLYQDKERLHSMYQIAMATTDNGGDNSYSWSEYYVDNIFLDRFCNLRVLDATIYNAQKLGYANPIGQEYWRTFWINELPTPIANSLGLKKEVQGTVCDHMVIGIFGDRYSIFGCKVGGDTGIGLFVFGYWYYAVLLLSLIAAFYFMCSFVNVRAGSLSIPIPILATFMTMWCFFNTANGIFTTLAIFTRANLNRIAIYCVVFFVLRLLTINFRKS